MAAPTSLCHLMGIDSKKFSKEENLILEMELYFRILHEIWHLCKKEYKNCVYLLEAEKENTMIDLFVIRCLINDLLKSEAYTVAGIAYYTQTPEEMIQDLMSGCKIGPMIAFARRLIELHKFVRPEIYKRVIEKILKEEKKK